jgi:glycosyltransferase involved in cell wall biosynthesis
MIDLSLIVPCYNEEGIVADTLCKAAAFLATTGRDYEIVVGDDGSTDGTARVVEEAAARDPRIRLARAAEHRGKGAILTMALLEGRGRVLAFIDADLEIDIASLGPLLEAIDGGADVAIGSKVLHPDWRARPLRRRLATRGYNVLVRALLGSRLDDHQAGIKAFRREPLREALRGIDNARWTWDTEVLVAAQSAGMRIREVPVTTTYQRPSKVSLLRQPLEMAVEVLRLFLSAPRRRAAAAPTGEGRA